MIAQQFGDENGIMGPIRDYGAQATAAQSLRYLGFSASFIPFAGGAASIGLDMWANNIEGKPAIGDGDGPYIAMTLGAGPLGKLGKIAKAAKASEEAAQLAKVPKITFGHGARHLEGTGLSVEKVESSILERVTTAATQSTTDTGSFWGRVNISGTTIEYRAYTLPDGTINVGTYYVP